MLTPSDLRLNGHEPAAFDLAESTSGSNPATRRRRLAAVAVALSVAMAGTWWLVTHVAANRACCQLSMGRALRVVLGELTGREYFGEIGQDRWVLERVFPGLTDGVFVDVGSGHGRIGSNTRALEQAGWTGVCIDPFPLEMRGRTCAVAKAVVYSRPGVDVAFKLAGGLGGIAELIAPWNVAAAEAPVVHMTTVTLADLLARHEVPPFVHYVSLDIEGAEYEALMGFPFERHRVGAWTIEHNREEPKRSRIRAVLEARGYRHVHSWHQDDFYVAVDVPY